MLVCVTMHGPRYFGSRESLSDAVSTLSLGVIMLCDVDLPYWEGFGFAPLVLLFSVFVLCPIGPPVACVGV